jgi:hypothetical protein
LNIEYISDLHQIQFMSSTLTRLLTVLLPLITILLVSSPIYAQVTILPGTDLPEIEIQQQNQSTPDQPPQQQTTELTTNLTTDLDTNSVSLKLATAHYIPLTVDPGNQVKLFVDYNVSNPEVVNKPINAIMEVYATNETLIRTSSFPSPIIANETGTIQLATTFNDDALKNVTAVVTVTDPSKESPISEPLRVPLTLGQVIE